MGPGGDRTLAVYRLRAVRLGAVTTLLAVASSGVYAAAAGHLAMGVARDATLAAAAAVMTALMAAVAGRRRLAQRVGLPALYVWTATCAALIDVAVAGTGGGRSPLWADNLLAVVFVAAVYPRRSHAPLLLLTAGGYAAALAATGWRIAPGTLMVRAATVAAAYVLIAFLARELAKLARGQARAIAQARHRADLLAGVAGVATEGLAGGSEAVLAAAVAAPLVWGQRWAAIWHLGTDGAAGHLGASEGLDDGTTAWLGAAAAGLAGRLGDQTRPLAADSAGGGIVAAPIRVGERLGAVLVSGASGEGPADAAEVEALGILAAEIGEALRSVELREAVAASESRFRGLVQHATDPVAVFTTSGEVLFTSPVYRQTFGIEPGTVDREALARHVHAQDLPHLTDLVRRAVARPGRPLVGEVRLADVRRPMAEPERWRTLELTLTDLSHEPVIGGIVANYHDVTARKAAEQAAAQAAVHDPLTGLANRALLQDRLDHAVRRLDRHPGLVGTILVDLDRFKAINDTFGHGAGDELLRTIATRLLRATRPEDTVARLGGDEFAITCEDLADARSIVQVATKVAETIREPIEVGGRELLVTPSIGVAVGGRGSLPNDLVRDADIALYRAKECGRDRIEVFDERLRLRVVEQAATEQALRRALELGQLHLVYQPVVDLGSGAVPMVEALLRWTHPVLGVVDPSQFIPLAEDTGLIQAIGEWTLGEACATVQQLRCGAPTEADRLRLAVNVSARQLLQGDLGAAVRRALAGSGLEPSGLILEVTESSVMSDYATAAIRMRALRRLGLDIAVDDFGTGYSSLAHLQDLPITALKIDRSFVTRLESSPNGRVIVGAVVGLASALGFDAIAEGVESLAQLQALRRAGCTLGQGFLWTPGLSPKRLVTWLRRTGPAGRLSPAAPCRPPMMASDAHPPGRATRPRRRRIPESVASA